VFLGDFVHAASAVVAAGHRRFRVGVLGDVAYAANAVLADRYLAGIGSPRTFTSNTTVPRGSKANSRSISR